MEAIIETYKYNIEVHCPQIKLGEALVVEISYKSKDQEILFDYLGRVISKWPTNHNRAWSLTVEAQNTKINVKMTEYV